MISLKVEGLDNLIKSLTSDQWLDDKEVDKVVKSAADPFVKALKANYAKHEKTGALINSIEAFRRTRRGVSDPFFTYYIGPRYTAGSGLRVSYGGNAAHLLEFGTVERFRANTKMGGMGKTLKGKSTGLKGVYGAKIDTGRMPAFGIIRRTKDEQKAISITSFS
jgi:hypothetical protein